MNDLRVYRSTGWLARVSAALRLVAVPAMYVAAMHSSGFYNPAGWGPAIVADVPPLLWFASASIALLRAPATMSAGTGASAPSAFWA